MGAWGTAIFSDDLASDIRSRYRDLVGDGLAGQQATVTLLVEYQNILDDPDAIYPMAVAGRVVGNVVRFTLMTGLTLLSPRTPRKTWRPD